jgi:hypothetical protein
MPTFIFFENGSTDKVGHRIAAPHDCCASWCMCARPFCWCCWCLCSPCCLFQLLMLLLLLAALCMILN